jgi:hypothetical protein
VVPPAQAVAPSVEASPRERSEPTFQEPYPVCSGREKRRSERRLRALSRQTMEL